MAFHHILIVSVHIWLCINSGKNPTNRIQTSVNTHSWPFTCFVIVSYRVNYVYLTFSGTEYIRVWIIKRQELTVPTLCQRADVISWSSPLCHKICMATLVYTNGAHSDSYTRHHFTSSFSCISNSIHAFYFAMHSIKVFFLGNCVLFLLCRPWLKCAFVFVFWNNLK